MKTRMKFQSTEEAIQFLADQIGSLQDNIKELADIAAAQSIVLGMALQVVRKHGNGADVPALVDAIHDIPTNTAGDAQFAPGVARHIETLFAAGMPSAEIVKFSPSGD